MSIQAFQGYFESGRFISPDIATIPEHKKVIVTVLDEPVLNRDSERNRLAWNKFFSDIAECDEKLPQEFDELLSQRVNFTRELKI